MSKLKQLIEQGVDSVETERFIHLRLEELRQLVLDKLEYSIAAVGARLCRDTVLQRII